MLDATNSFTFVTKIVANNLFKYDLKLNGKIQKLYEFQIFTHYVTFGNSTNKFNRFTPKTIQQFTFALRELNNYLSGNTADETIESDFR